ncbi:hypothetical protein ABZ864_15085 [Streptomyces sp. NPDC047082]|uniref:DUF6891 domain-containing protein n=1 Tax=Streptomyces sp. NPDC047082 TaxID=3155259 RepID=UPI00292D2E55|nr:hypothetical protein [Streptomyces sp. NEAU-HV9]
MVLRHATTAVGHEAVAGLTGTGLSAVWDGNPDAAIELTSLTWHKRLWGEVRDVGLAPRKRPSSERRLLPRASVCFNGRMVGFQKVIATGRHDLEPFWPSRQHHDFDRVCCGAMNAPAL